MLFWNNNIFMNPLQFRITRSQNNAYGIYYGPITKTYLESNTVEILKTWC